MRIALFILPCAALGILLGVMVAGVKKGTNIFKLPVVAWMLTGVMVVVAIGIGIEKTEGAPVPEPAPRPSSDPAVADFFVRDDANVLSAQTERELALRNERLWERHNVTIGVVTCNYNKDDLYQYAAKQFEEMGMGGYDMLVVLDIRGDNYWLYTGDSVAWDFSDEDCSNYTYDYMEGFFAQRMYDDAVLSLTEALEVWYSNYF